MNTNSGRNGRVRARRAKPRRNGDLNSSIPYAASFVPSDPPTVKPNLRRSLIVVGRGTTDTTTGALVVDESDVKLAINGQVFGVASAISAAQYNYQVIKVNAWGGADDSTAITLTDIVSGISSTDSGAFTLRPKVGIHYPPASRKLRGSGAGADEFIRFDSASTEDTPIEYHLSIEFWTLSKPQI